jgi:hypothetical protein
LRKGLAAGRLAAVGAIISVGLGAAGTSATAGSSPSKIAPPALIHADNALGVQSIGTGIVGLGLGGGAGAGPLLSGGGPVQHNPKVYIVFWGWGSSDPSGEAPYLENFFNGVGGSGWANIQTQYSDGAGSVTNPTGQLKGYWFDNTSSLPASPSDAQVAAEALVAATHFGYDVDADYFVATPHGHSDPGFAGAGQGGTYCAYHSMTTDGSGRVVAFTNLPYQTDAGTSCGQNFVNAGSAGLLDGVSIVGGHEYAEAITDPQVGSGWTDATFEETGDKCAWISSGFGVSQNITLSTGTFAVQTLWSNAANSGLGDCVAAYP